MSLASVPPAVSWPGAPFPRRGPSGRFPRVHGTSEALRLPATPPAAFRCLHLAVPRLHPCFAPGVAGCDDGGPGVGHPVPPTGTYRGGEGASQVPGRPVCERALFSDPGGTAGARPLRRRGTAFRYGQDVGSRELNDFGAQWHGPLTRCLRFAAPVTRAPRKTRSRPLAKLCRTGVGTPRGPNGRFLRYNASSFPKLSWRTNVSSMNETDTSSL